MTRGEVLASGAVAENPARLVGAGEPVVVVAAPARFVGRGGEKLDAAVERFGVPVAGRRVVDAGASTGGFTDCVLQRGAAWVVAIDVGYGQMHERVAGDGRVEVFDRTNVRGLTADQIGGPADLVVADLSFISLRTVLASLIGLARPGADLVVLVKPQFEADRDEASRGRGVIADPDVWTRALDDVVAAFAERGATIMGVMPSPITGGRGNVEFLLHAVAPSPTSAGEQFIEPRNLASMIAAAVATADDRTSVVP